MCGASLAEMRCLFLMSKDPRVLNVKFRNVVTCPCLLSDLAHIIMRALYKQAIEFEVRYFTLISYLFMTFISSDTRATQRRASVTGIVLLKVNSTRTILPIAPSAIVPSQPESTTLVRDFILSFKELENYKSVHLQFTT